MRRFPADGLDDIVVAHPLDISGGVASVDPRGDLVVSEVARPKTLRLAGELDAINADWLAETVKDRSHGVEIRVDLVELRFADVAGLRALVDAAVNGLVLIGPSPVARWILEVTGLDRRPGMRIAEAGE